MTALEKTLRAIVLTGLFALPFICLIVTTSLYFPYITGKNFAFRIIVEIITGAWLALALVFPQYRPKRSWILGAITLFVILIAIADAQGVNPFKSFWSNFERMDGWVTLIHVLLLTVVASVVMNSEKLWRRFWQVSLGVSLFVALYGFLQIAGTLALGAGGAGGLSARIDATFGNPIYLAVYMLFHVFVAALLWLQIRREKPAGGVPLYLSVFYGAAIVLDTAALFFTGTRGTMLGLIGGAFLALIIFACTSEASQRLRRFTVAAVVVILVLGGAIWVGRDTSLVKNIGFLDRLATISTSDTTIASRFINMQIAWQGVKEKPIFGWGQENYAIVFDKYYDPRMYADEAWFDRVHDIIFDWWIAGGTLGLLSYLSIFAATLWVLWRRKATFSVAEKSILTGLLAGYFFHNLTVFDNITSYILFAFVLAYITWRSEVSTPPIAQGTLPRSALPYVAALCAVLVWGAAWFVNAGALAQNRTLIQAISQQSAGPMQNLALFNQAIAFGTYGTQEAREQLIQIASQVASAQGLDDATKQQFFTTAANEMMLQEKASPLDARFPLFLGILEDSYGDYADAATALEKAHELSPKKQAILFEIGQNQEAQGDTAGALQTFATAYNLDTNDTDAALYYASGAIRAKQDTLANQLLAPLIPTGKAADPRITAAYVSRNDYKDVVTIWLPYVKANPTDTSGYFTLAAAYVGIGDSADAIATLKQVEQVSSSTTAQAEALITEIKNGTATVQQ